VADVKRSYETKIKRGQAPELVTAAASRLFALKGYVATSIDDIAREAGVARPTVFSAVGTKPVILRAVVDQAIAGDDAPIPVAERAWWREAADEEDAAAAVARMAHVMTLINGRAAPIVRALEVASWTDGDAAAVWERYQQQRWNGLNEFAVLLAKKAGSDVRLDVKTMTDTLWTLSPSAYVRLVLDAGWTPERFETWLADLLARLFLT
jgi:AcrR family transcriptional regulator